MSNASKSWIDQARYDLETARAMFASGRYIYVLFCCQQAVEKMLKAIIVARTNDFPPRLHNLLRLAEIAGVALEPEREDLLGELSGYYIQTRYPEEIEPLVHSVDAEPVRLALEKTEWIVGWLLSMVK